LSPAAAPPHFLAGPGVSKPSASRRSTNPQTGAGCRAAGAGTASDGDAELQPIWLAADDAAPNGARFLFLIDGASSARLGEFDRVFDLFDGNDEAAVVAARGRWTAAKAAGYTLTYWQQGARGWEKKA